MKNSLLPLIEVRLAGAGRFLGRLRDPERGSGDLERRTIRSRTVSSGCLFQLFLNLSDHTKIFRFNLFIYKSVENFSLNTD